MNLGVNLLTSLFFSDTGHRLGQREKSLQRRVNVERRPNRAEW